MPHLGHGGLGLQDVVLGGGAGLLLAAHAAPGATNTHTELYTGALTTHTFNDFFIFAILPYISRYVDCM